MPRLFINYRRADSQGFAGRIYDRLAKAFGRRNVFMDMETLNPGEKFVEAIEREATGRNAMLVLIGPNWLSPIGESNKTRLDDPADYVRREIEMASNKNMHIIPILLQDAKLPSPESLPTSLHGILSHNAFAIGPDFHSDIGQLIRRVKQIADPNRGKQILIGLFTAALILKFIYAVPFGPGVGLISLPDVLHLGGLAISMAAVYLGLRWVRYLFALYCAFALPVLFIVIFIAFFNWQPEIKKLISPYNPTDAALITFLAVAFLATEVVIAYVLVRSSSVRAFLELQRRKYFHRLKD